MLFDIEHTNDVAQIGRYLARWSTFDEQQIMKMRYSFAMH